MNKQELIQKLSALPPGLPVMMKVDQDITGMGDLYVWMRGEPSKVYVEDLYLDPRQGDDGAYTDRDSLDDRIDLNPDDYLGEDILDVPDSMYEVKKNEFLDTLPWEKVIVIEVLP